MLLRGQEITVGFIVEGIPQVGSFTRVIDFNARPDTEIKKIDHLGEPETDFDIQHHGWELSMTVHVEDSAILDYTEELILREQEHTSPQSVSLQVTYSFRDDATPNKQVTYYGVVLKQEDDGFRGRKEHLEVKLVGNAKRRHVIEVSKR